MRFLKKYILFLTCLTISAINLAQFDPTSISRIEDGKIQFSLDIRWSDSQKKEIEKLFNLDSTLWLKLNVNTSGILLNGEEWKVRYISPFIVELSKNLGNQPVFHFNENDIFLIDDNWLVAPGYVDQEKVIYGANSLKKDVNFQYRDGEARFFLPGYLKSQQVYVAGSFNNWNPVGTAMQKVDAGWIAAIPLPAGKYFYKFIVDGNWMTDPNNNLSENDGQGNINSTLYCPNYLFQLDGYSKARRVTVAGTFNKWNRRELKMNPTHGGWSLPVYLRNGTYSYKFIVDDTWITDPANSNTRTDAKGNMNSVIGFGDEYFFRLNGFTNSERALVAGNFNNWDPDELMMQKTTDGWELPYQLAPGNHEYKFIVDGRWMTDPSNPYIIGSGDYANSCLAFKANYTFSLDNFPDAGEVKLTGSFNNWNPDGYKMVKKEGIWTFPLYLSEGKHLYKLIVDGKWMTDPTNKLWEENEFGTGNSVLWKN